MNKLKIWYDPAINNIYIGNEENKDVVSYSAILAVAEYLEANDIEFTNTYGELRFNRY